MPQALYANGSIAREHEHLADARRIADLMDSKYALPFGWRIGWDGILGLVPGIGDFTTNLFAFYILYKAALLGCTPSIVLRMGLNILIDNVIDTIPVLGNFLDFAWKANIKNVALIESYLQQPARTRRSSQVVVFLTLAMLAAVVIGLGVLTFYLAQWLWGVFRAAW